jgi:hypothetical protein
MYTYKIINKKFLLSYLIVGFFSIVLFKFDVVKLAFLIQNIGTIISLISIFFLVNINRVIDFKYAGLISLKSVLFIYSQTIGVVFLFVIVLEILVNFDLAVFFKNFLLFSFLLTIGSYSQVRIKNEFIKYCLLFGMYLFISVIS